MLSLLSWPRSSGNHFNGGNDLISLMVVMIFTVMFSRRSLRERASHCIFIRRRHSL